MIFESYEEVKMDIAVSANVDYKDGMFSGSTSYRRAQELMSNSSKYIADTTAFFSAFQADLSPYWATSSGVNFLKFVKYELPKTYEENPDKYEELFREYGTHFFTGGQFGGLYRLTITLDKTLRTKMSEENIKININATIFENLKAIGAFDDQSIEINSEFQSLSQTTARYYGGNIPMEGPTLWKNWFQSVPKNPWLFSGYLTPITNLIPDDEEKKGAVILAMETHLAIAYLKDMVINLKYFSKRNNIEEKNNRTIIKFTKQSENILSEIPVDPSAAKSLALEIKQFLIDNQPPPPELMSEFGVAKIAVLSAVVPDKRILPILPDPFIKVFAAGNYIGQTSADSGTTRPHWNKVFTSGKIHVSSTINFDIYDEKIYKDVYIGSVSVSIKDIIRRNLNATETSLFRYELYVKITWIPSSKS